MQVTPQIEETSGAEPTGAVEAELIFTMAGRAPDVMLAFNGLEIPEALFADLRQIGWGIPSVPPPPGTAIDWTPDPTTGEDYTIKPWKVAEFRLTPSDAWTVESEKIVAQHTIHALQRHGAEITGLRGQTEAAGPDRG